MQVENRHSEPREEDLSVEIREVGFESLATIAKMNQQLFSEDRIINRFNRPDLIMLVAFADGAPAGFKIGYGVDGRLYYSAKGGVIEPFRRSGIARRLLADMMRMATDRGYIRFAFDTFPNIHVGMTLMAIEEGFVLTNAEWSEGFTNYRLRFAKALEVPGSGP